ncbi:MAG: GNAT family N-acetyltransferase [Hyphomonadaceae bacterium]|nr:GNAT family N-acetyltransferase [Hyphomonadaceae bacterium]
MRFALIKIGALPASFAALREAAELEGYAFVRRLGDRWDGERYEDDALATVWGAIEDNALVAIAAQTFDEYDPSPRHRRIRHFYVRPDMRRGGVGRALAARLIADAHALAPLLHLRATHALSTAFWDRMGFARVEQREDRTHVLVRT